MTRTSSTTPPPPTGPTDEEAGLRRAERISLVETEAAEAALGAVVGGIVGAMAGPVGIAAGAALGGGIGAALAHAAHRADHEEVEHQRDLEAGRIEPLPEEDALPGRSAEELERELAAPVTNA